MELSGFNGKHSDKNVNMTTAMGGVQTIGVLCTNIRT